MLRGFKIPFQEDVEIQLTRARSQKSRITVLFGENGTRKSSVLRGLLEDGLRDDSSVRRALLTAKADFDFRPSKVIAVSASAGDRFPAGGSVGMFATRYDTARYIYAGPKSGRNIVSRSQSLESLLLASLECGRVSPRKRAFISDLSKKTRVPYRLQARVFRANGLAASHPESSRDYFNRLSDRLAKRRLPIADELDELLKGGIEKYDFSELDEFGHACRSGMECVFDLNDAGGINGFSAKTAAMALRYGFVRLRPTTGRFHREEDIDRYSSGQWGLFSSLATLALAARDDTLVLIDEPENALHPAWQREYLTELNEAISEHRSCHVVIATHSPLIVGAMSKTLTDLIELSLSVDGEVGARSIVMPRGWASTDVLEDVFNLSSTRSPELTSTVNEALRLIGRGTRENAAAIKRLGDKLFPWLEDLPVHDPIRAVISAIVDVNRVRLK